MAVAWIAYRTAGDVRNWWNAYRTECWDWHFSRWRLGVDGSIHEGYFLEQRSLATLARLELAGIFDQESGNVPASKLTIREAKKALWVSLREGLIEATGINVVSGVREMIWAHSWHDLESFEQYDREAIASRTDGMGSTLRFNEVLVWRKALTGMWPEIAHVPTRLPELMPPGGPGYMPLYCAAQWIATRGGERTIETGDEGVWKAAFDELLARLSSDQVKVTGIRNGEREILQGHLFAACPVGYPFPQASAKAIFGDQVYLQSYPFLDETAWNSGYDDSLRDRRGVRWSQLMVLKEDIARYWPAPDARYQTGAPGRPSSMYLVEAEFQARCERREVASNITTEAQYLAQWLRDTHPGHPILRPKSIRNKLASSFRQHQSAQN